MPYNSKINGKNVVLALQALGPTYIKLGQSLSSRVDILGENIATQLLSLCDKVPPFSNISAISIIESELSEKVEILFSEFMPIPIASASIAQVYKAKLTDGKEVAIKVLRPNIEKMFKKDIATLRLAAYLLNMFPAFKRLRLVEIVNLFAQSCNLELDLRFEAANAEELKENTKNDKGFRVPLVYWQYTRRRILTTEWIEGVPIYDLERIKNPEKIAENLVMTFCNQCYRDCFFHADMHPGNLLVDNNGNLVVVDFGIMGRLDRITGIYVAEILAGFLKKDYAKIAKIHFNAGYVKSHNKNFITACRAIGAPIVGQSVKKISAAELLSQLFKITSDFDMPVQPQLALLQKTMILIEGACRRLYPEINIWEIAEKWFDERPNNGTLQYLEKAKNSKVGLLAKSLSRIINKSEELLDLKIKEKNKNYYKTFCFMLIGITAAMKYTQKLHRA